MSTIEQRFLFYVKDVELYLNKKQAHISMVKGVLIVRGLAKLF